MIQKILKAFLSSDKLAKQSAKAIKKAVNASDKEATIAKYATMAAEATKIQTQIVEWLRDGKIDDTEEIDIAATLKPLYDQILRLI